MSWAAKRTTTRSEDVAYCLLGIFDVNMPLLYGEGSTKAFVRLQEEIMKGSDDQSLFAWYRPNASSEAHGLLAKSPLDFIDSGSVRHISDVNDPHAMTNKGLQITLQMARLGGDFHVALLCCTISGDRVAIVLRRFPSDRYFRVALDSLKFQEAMSSLSFLGWDATQELCISKKNHIRAEGPVLQRLDQLQLHLRRLPNFTNKHLRFQSQSSKLVSSSPSATPIMIMYSQLFAIICLCGSNNCSLRLLGSQLMFC
jgi:hypothetical protein